MEHRAFDIYRAIQATGRATRVGHSAVRGVRRFGLVDTYLPLLAVVLLRVAAAWVPGAHWPTLVRAATRRALVADRSGSL